MIDRRDPKHRKFVSLLNCAACGAPPPSECAHVRMSHFDGVMVPPDERGGTGMKPADRWSVPMCHHCHHDQHQFGERTFWTHTGRNPLAIAQSLWRNSGNIEAARGIVGRARLGSVIG